MVTPHIRIAYSRKFCSPMSRLTSTGDENDNQLVSGSRLSCIIKNLSFQEAGNGRLRLRPQKMRSAFPDVSLICPFHNIYGRNSVVFESGIEPHRRGSAWAPQRTAP